MDLEPDFAQKTEGSVLRRQLRSLEAKLKKKPKDALLLARRGILKLELELDLDDAVADCEHAMKLDPQLSLAWSGRSSARLLRGDWKGTVADATQALERNPDDVRALVDRGMARHELGQLDEAIADFDRALELKKRGGIYASRGKVKGLKRDYVGAAADFKRAVDLEPEPRYLDLLLTALARLPRSARALAERGLERIDRGDLAGALADADAALALDANEPRAYACRGAARLQQGDPKAALADFTRTIELDAADAVAAFNRGQCWLQLEDFARAQADYQLAVEREPEHADAWINLGSMKKRAGDAAGALAAFDRAIALGKIAPEHLGNLLFSRAQLLTQLADHAAALTQYQQLLKIYPGSEDQLAPLIDACRVKCSS